MDKNGKNDCQIYDTDDLEKKVKKVDVRMPSSINSAKTSLMLPTDVIKPKRIEQEVTKAKVQTVSSSGSATGKSTIFINYRSNQNRRNNTRARVRVPKIYIYKIKKKIYIYVYVYIFFKN